MGYINITDDLNARGRKELKVGQTMHFDFEGSPVYLKIMKKEGGKVWAKRLDPKKYLTPEEADDQVMVERKKL